MILFNNNLLHKYKFLVEWHENIICKFYKCELSHRHSLDDIAQFFRINMIFILRVTKAALNSRNHPSNSLPSIKTR